MNLPQIINQSEQPEIQPKDDDDQMMGMASKATKAGNYVATIRWSSMIEQFRFSSKTDVVKSMRQLLLLQTPYFSEEWATNQLRGNLPVEWVRSSALLFMSTPEYQLC